MVHTTVEEDVANVMAGICWKSSKMVHKCIEQAAQPKRKVATALESADEKHAVTNWLVARMDPAEFGVFSGVLKSLRVRRIDGGT